MSCCWISRYLGNPNVFSSEKHLLRPRLRCFRTISPQSELTVKSKYKAMYHGLLAYRYAGTSDQDWERGVHTHVECLDAALIHPRSYLIRFPLHKPAPPRCICMCSACTSGSESNRVLLKTPLVFRALHHICICFLRGPASLPAETRQEKRRFWLKKQLFGVANIPKLGTNSKRNGTIATTLESSVLLKITKNQHICDMMY